MTTMEVTTDSIAVTLWIQPCPVCDTLTALDLIVCDDEVYGDDTPMGYCPQCSEMVIKS